MPELSQVSVPEHTAPPSSPLKFSDGSSFAYLPSDIFEPHESYFLLPKSQPTLFIFGQFYDCLMENTFSFDA